MNKTLVIIAVLIIALHTSCASKQEKILAINVLLTLPDALYQQSIELNQAILNNQADNLTLDANHIPHITLLQCYVKERDLAKIQQELSGLYKSIGNVTLLADELQYAREKTESFASIGINKSEALMALHKKTIALLQAYIQKEGSQEAYVQNADGSPIDDFTIAYVPKFVSAHSFENYNPHISLGMAKTNLLDSLDQQTFKTMTFQATSISIYQLGTFGTAQKLLWKSE